MVKSALRYSKIKKKTLRWRVSATSTDFYKKLNKFIVNKII